MNKYAIANRTSGKVVVDYGTFATVAEAADFILYDRLIPWDDLANNTSLLYITEAEESDFAQGLLA